MKKLTILTVIAATAALSAGAASAQPGRWMNNGQWQNINARQAELDRRIDVGVRRGQINRGEAVRLRSEFNNIARMEQRYRRDGLSMRERADLDRRFDALAARVRWERNDREYGMGYGRR